VFVTGMSAVTFKQLAYVVSFSLLCSLVVALTIVPVLCSRYLGRGANGNKRNLFQRLADAVGRGQDRLAENYGGVLRWSLDHKLVTVALAGGLFGLAYLGMPLIGVELQPEADEGEVRVNVELEPGTRVGVTDSVMNQLASIAREEIPEALNIMVESGGGGFRSNGSHMGELRIQLKSQAERERSAKDIAAAIRPQMTIQPGMVVRTRVSSMMMRRGGGSDDRLAVEIRGHDLEILGGLAEQVRKAMLSVEGVPEVQVSRQPGMPEMVLRVDRLKAATMGLNVSDVANAMETAVGGRRTSMFRQQGDEFNIIVRLKETDRMDVTQVGKVPLVTVGGTPVPAESIVQMRRQEGPTSIDRVDQERVVTVSGTLGARDLGSVMKDLRAKLVEIPRPSGYEFTYGGEYEEQQEAFQELTFAAILALILVYMVMAAQFESLRDPFIILFSIPLAAVGVVTILIVTQTTFNMQAFLGIIMLVGIVVNNAILLVDYTNQLRREHGIHLREAVVTAGIRRLRPVLMTTVTTVLGLTPMALGIGEGSELQQPMARVVIGGLLSSTLITLVVIPTIYYLLELRTEPAEEGESEPTLQPAGD
jgi:hydrophobic/amphiphilic exporter-1 (mainly G- bacteria), HAE1 family